MLTSAYEYKSMFSRAHFNHHCTYLCKGRVTHFIFLISIPSSSSTLQCIRLHTIYRTVLRTRKMPVPSLDEPPFLLSYQHFRVCLPASEGEAKCEKHNTPRLLVFSFSRFLVFSFAINKQDTHLVFSSSRFLVCNQQARYLIPPCLHNLFDVSSRVDTSTWEAVPAYKRWINAFPKPKQRPWQDRSSTPTPLPSTQARTT